MFWDSEKAQHIIISSYQKPNSKGTHCTSSHPITWQRCRYSFQTLVISLSIRLVETHVWHIRQHCKLVHRWQCWLPEWSCHQNATKGCKIMDHLNCIETWMNMMCACVWEYQRCTSFWMVPVPQAARQMSMHWPRQETWVGWKYTRGQDSNHRRRTGIMHYPSVQGPEPQTTHRDHALSVSSSQLEGRFLRTHTIPFLLSP